MIGRFCVWKKGIAESIFHHGNQSDCLFLLNKTAYCFTSFNNTLLVDPFLLYIFLFCLLQVVLDCTFYGGEDKEFNVESAARDFKSYVKDKEDLLSADLVSSTS